jgi:hypothetical protein
MERKREREKVGRKWFGWKLGWEEKVCKLRWELQVNKEGTDDDDDDVVKAAQSGWTDRQSLTRKRVGLLSSMFCI